MSDWIETYRGTVSAWECDIVEHFTIAYYFDRFADATRNFVELIGEGETLAPRINQGPSRLCALFQHELRAGAAFHILSALTSVDASGLHVGHQVVESASGKVVTGLAETLALPPSLAASNRQKLQGLAVAWPGPEIPKPTPSAAPSGALSARDRVKPWEIADTGAMSLPAHVHRFSGAGMHFLTSIGMNANYMSQNRRGFSTFLLDVDIADLARPGERIDVHTSVLHLGNTSLKYVHHMTAGDGRRIASMVQAGVQLDLDARRPTAFPTSIRDAITERLSQR